MTRGLSTGTWRCLICWFTLLQLTLPAIDVLAGDTNFTISAQTLCWAKEHYGVSAKNRLLAWQELMRSEAGEERTTLNNVNIFFNKNQFIDDYAHWGKNDYWATPTEFLASGGGDCEDFAIAKYFTLISLGIAEEQLTLTYVKALRLNTSHMVLTYYPAANQEPLILDNLINTIEPAHQRTDLQPVYSFNSYDLWDAKIRGQRERVGIARKIVPWRELLNKMDQDVPSCTEDGPNK